MCYIVTIRHVSNLGISVFLFAAIKSLDTLNDQIVQYLFSPKATEIDFDNDLSAKDKEALQSSMALMRQLLQVCIWYQIVEIILKIAA